MPIQINTQPIEKPEGERPEGALDVVSVFRTIQGEGPYAGCPAVFVRLAGCNLQCPACDTNYTEGRTMMSAHDLLMLIEDVSVLNDDDDEYTTQTALVVITGGEPFRQDFSQLAYLLLDHNYTVQVESNGTLYSDKYPWTEENFVVVISPKTPAINERMASKCLHFKYVIDAKGGIDADDGLPAVTLNGLRPARPHRINSGVATVWVQPMDSQDEEENQKNIQAAVLSCMTYGYRLCLQTHKIVGLD